MSSPVVANPATRVRHQVRRLVRRGHELLGDVPVLLPLHLALTPEGIRERTVTADTDLVIEGFPRSGNTYAVFAFRQLQDRPVRVVSHVHIPAQVRRAARLGVPTLVVFRPPADAVVSMAVADPHHHVADLLRYWKHYHEVVLRVADHVVFAPFDQVTGDFGIVVTRLNECFGTTFAAGIPDDDRVFAELDAKQRRIHGEDGFARGVARPDGARAGDQARRRAELGTGRCPDLLAEAEAVHQCLLDRT